MKGMVALTRYLAMQPRQLAITAAVAATACGAPAQTLAPVASGAPPTVATPAPAKAPPHDWTSVLAGDLPDGCFARSPDAVACIAERSSTQLPTTQTLAIVSLTGDERRALASDADRADLLATLSGGGFQPIEAPIAADHAPFGQRPTLTAPALQLAWQVTSRTPIVTDEGSWDETVEQLSATSPRACTFGEIDMQGIEDTSLQAWPLGGGGFAIERTLGYGLEGEAGGQTEVFVLAPHADCPT